MVAGEHGHDQLKEDEMARVVYCAVCGVPMQADEATWIGDATYCDEHEPEVVSTPCHHYRYDKLEKRDLCLEDCLPGERECGYIGNWATCEEYE